MSAAMEDLAKQLAAHPRFRWRAGMQPIYVPAEWVWGSTPHISDDDWRPEHCEDIEHSADGTRTAWPDLRDDATAGVLLGDLRREAGVERVAVTLGDDTASVIVVCTPDGAAAPHEVGWCRGFGSHGTCLGEPVARALLAVWGGGVSTVLPWPKCRACGGSGATYRVEHHKTVKLPCPCAERTRRLLAFHEAAMGLLLPFDGENECLWCGRRAPEGHAETCELAAVLRLGGEL